jgi:cold shock CspA family protein
MSTTVSDSQNTTYLGRVKWFNNKAGFGFVTCLDGDRKDEDVFVHHTGVVVNSEQYKYLVQGEYVNFGVKSTESEEHPYQAHNVTGVLGGNLMCETRNEMRQTSVLYNENKRSNSSGKRRGRNRQQNNNSENDNWVVEQQKNSSVSNA